MLEKYKDIGMLVGREDIFIWVSTPKGPILAGWVSGRKHKINSVIHTEHLIFYMHNIQASGFNKERIHKCPSQYNYTHVVP